MMLGREKTMFVTRRKLKVWQMELNQPTAMRCDQMRSVVTNRGPVNGIPAGMDRDEFRTEPNYSLT